jgi:hypothetical protein
MRIVSFFSKIKIPYSVIFFNETMGDAIYIHVIVYRQEKLMG